MKVFFADGRFVLLNYSIALNPPNTKIVVSDGALRHNRTIRVSHELFVGIAWRGGSAPARFECATVVEYDGNFSQMVREQFRPDFLEENDIEHIIERTQWAASQFNVGDTVTCWWTTKDGRFAICRQ